MTDEQKDILLAKMLDAPSSLSDGELEMIMHDEELKDIYEMSSSISGACMKQPEFDMNEEWRRFQTRLRRRKFKRPWIMRVAAIFIGIMIIGGFAGKIVDYIFMTDQPTILAKTEQPNSPGNAAAQCDSRHSEQSIALTTPSEDKEDKAPASSRKLAQAKAFEPTVTKTEEDVNIDEYLRIEQARIDNDLALLKAEEIEDLYNDMLQNHEDIDIDFEELNNTINTLTMQ